MKGLSIVGGAIILFGLILLWGNGPAYEVLAVLTVGLAYVIIGAGIGFSRRLRKSKGG